MCWSTIYFPSFYFDHNLEWNGSTTTRRKVKKEQIVVETKAGCVYVCVWGWEMKIKSTAVCAVKIGMPQFSIFYLFSAFSSSVCIYFADSIIDWIEFSCVEQVLISQEWLFCIYFMFTPLSHTQCTRTHAPTHKHAHEHELEQTILYQSDERWLCWQNVRHFIFWKVRLGQIFDSMEVLNAFDSHQFEE